MESLNEKIIPLRIKSKGSMRGDCMRSKGQKRKKNNEEKKRSKVLIYGIVISVISYFSPSLFFLFLPFLSLLSEFFFFLKGSQLKPTPASTTKILKKTPNLSPLDLTPISLYKLSLSKKYSRRKKLYTHGLKSYVQVLNFN